LRLDGSGSPAGSPHMAASLRVHTQAIPWLVQGLFFEQNVET
jgi:hypothetical protein